MIPPQSKHKSADSKNKDVAPFLKNLRKMLDQESDEILRWTPNGRAFEIHDMQRMMEHVLPKYFKHRKYTSFQRQLNYFNFKKWTKSKAAVCTFSNDYFLRDHADLSWRISRKKSVPSSSSSSSPLSMTTSSPSSSSKPKSSQRANATASGNAMTSTTMHSNEPHAWKAHDMMAITVPRMKAEPQYDSFPSPTDMEVMLMENETDVQRYYNQITINPHGEDSLDWFESCMLPSLEMQPKSEEPQYYTHYAPMSSMPNYPSIVRSNPYAAPSYYSLPAPTNVGNFACMSTAL